MCKGNTIITSWSKLGACIAFPVIIILILVCKDWTWGEISLIPFIILFILNGKHCFYFTDSGFTTRWEIFKRMIPKEDIQQIDVYATKSGTWILIRLHGTQEITAGASRMELFFYYLRNLRKSFLIPLEWGERDKAVELLCQSFPHKVVMM